MRGRSRRRFGLTALVGVVAALLSIVGPALAAPQVVKISDLKFGPAQVHVTVGDQLTWQNLDPVAHNVHGSKGGFDFTIPAGDTRSITFTMAGTFAYLCQIVPSMKGSIIVDAVGSAPAPSVAPSPVVPPPTDTDLPGGGTPFGPLPALWITLLLGAVALVVARALTTRTSLSTPSTPVRALEDSTTSALRGVVRVSVHADRQSWRGRASVASSVSVPSLLNDAVTDSGPSTRIDLSVSSTGTAPDESPPA